ncbi:MAG: UvrD-helicase domain-containing protein, partial [Treponema sp.]|nr:UvrD-helicase domain-containing protein [Treponema sp.]
DMIFAYIIHVDDAKDIMQLLDTFMMSINGIKRRTGHLTFADVSELALDILRTCDDIRQQEHDMYRRIMIDEFQDNNRKNGELLDLLQRPIFFVGDDKQSIYKFRGAEVAVFNDKQNAMLQGQGSVLHMDFNYRSNIELLHAFNQIFGGYVVKDPEALKKTDSTKAEKFKKIITVASDANDTDYPWVFPENFATDSNGNPVDLYKARFTIESTAEKNPEVTAKPEDLFINNNPLHCAVPVHAVMYNIHSIEDSPQKKDYLDAHKRLGKYVAATILCIHAECKKTNQSFSFSDFAILEKSRTNRSAYTDFLSSAGIPYVVDQQSNLFAEALVTDFYNFIRLCVYPFDVQAFASFLRSPFCGLSQHGVETVLCTAIKDPESPDAQPVVLQSFDDQDTDAIVAQLKGSDKDKYIKASTLFHTYQARIRSQKLTDTIRQLWVDLGYCYNIWWHKDLSVFAEQYDLLFALACRCDENNCTVPWFVDQLSKLQKMDNRKADSELNVKEISYPVESADAVSIMSIHKSKGLQFKYVFIVGCTGALSAESNSDMYFYTEQYGISVKYTDNKQNFFFKMQQDEATAKNDAEFRRQFYVALTRAEQQAWILGTWSQPLKDTSTSKPSLLERIFQHYYPILPQVQQDELDATGTEQTTLSLNESAPFDFTELYPVLQRIAYINAQKDSVDKQAMLKKIDELTPFFDTYADSALVTIPNLVIRRTSPSRFESDDTTEKSITSVDAYTDVNAIIESTWDDNTQKYGFGYNNFGTLVHLFLEMNAKGVDVSTFIPPANFVAHLYDTNRQCIFDTCRTMVAGFNESAVGKEFLQCRDTFYRTEYAFRMKLAGYFVTGSIDLVYKAGDIFHIVDYKTDKAIHPEKYYEQLYCYRRALEGLLHIDPEHITCTLYYVRHACAIDVTQDVAKITEEHLQEKLVLFDKVVF